jgi:dienelactone hydrolase
MRRTGPAGAPAVLCLNGGVKRAMAGDWSTSIDWLVGRLAPARPEVAFYEVRYRVRSWTRLEMCIEDARAALAAVAGDGAPRVALLGYSMGGAVSVAVAAQPAVTAFVGLAPWLPREIGVDALVGRRAAVIHGSVDGRPFGVSPRQSRRAVERMRALGIEAGYHLIRGALHALALPGPGDAFIPLPRAAEWERLTGAEIDRFQGAG